MSEKNSTIKNKAFLIQHF